jgi:hypothetical protein
LAICVGGVFGAWESSLAQVKTNSKDMYRESFFISQLLIKYRII